MSGGVPVPVDRLQDVTCVRRMAFHGDHIICRLGDQGRGLAGGVQRIHCDDMSCDVTPLQQVLGGRDLATLVVEVEHRKRRTGRMIGERDRLVMPLPVAVGGTDALAIRRPCCRERKTRACPTMHDILERLGVDGLEHVVDRGLGDRVLTSRRKSGISASSASSERMHHAPRMTQSVMECQRKNADRHIFFARCSADPKRTDSGRNDVPSETKLARATDQHVLSIKKWQKTARDGLAQRLRHTGQTGAHLMVTFWPV